MLIRKKTLAIAAPLVALMCLLYFVWVPPAGAAGPMDNPRGLNGVYFVTADGGPLGMVHTMVKLDSDGTYIARGFDAFGLNQTPPDHWDGPQYGTWRFTGPRQITAFDYHQSFSNPFGPPQVGIGIPIEIVRNTFVLTFDPTFTEGILVNIETRVYAPNEDPLDPTAGTIIPHSSASATVRRVPTP